MTGRRADRTIAFGAVLCLAVAGCSGGSGSAGGTGDLSARALWQQPAGAASDQAVASGAASGGGFGSELPASVNTVRFVFAPENGAACCVAVDPLDIPIDPDIGQRRVVLKRLPAGPGELTIAGFPGAAAAAPSGASETCGIEPSSAAMSCVAGLVDTPSYLSAAQPVDVLGAGQVDAGDIEIPALPFVVPGSLEPAPGVAVGAPLRVRAVIAIGAGSVRESSIALAISSVGGLGVETVPCDDAGASPCSAGGDLEVTGFAVQSALTEPPLGAAEVEVAAASSAGGAPLGLVYGFTVESTEATATPQDTPAATRTPAPPSPTPATPEPTGTRSPTRTSTPVPPTPTRFPTSGGPTATPSATPGTMCPAAPRSECRRTTEALASSLLLEKAGADGRNDNLLFRWDSGDFTDVRAFGDPGLTTSYAICLYDEVDDVPQLRRQWFVPPGPDCPATGCWQPTEDGFRYVDPSQARDGIERINLVAGLPGRASILVNGGGPNLDLPSLPLAQDQSVLMQVINNFGSGECWEESFRLPATRNTSTEFRDRGDGPIS